MLSCSNIQVQTSSVLVSFKYILFLSWGILATIIIGATANGPEIYLIILRYSVLLFDLTIQSCTGLNNYPTIP